MISTSDGCVDSRCSRRLRVFRSVRSIPWGGMAISALIAVLAACTVHQAPAPAAAVSTAFPLGNTPPSGRDPATIPPPMRLSVEGGFALGTAQPTIFDSRTVAQQIDRRVMPGSQQRPGSLLPTHKRPPIEIGTPNDLVYGSQRMVPRNDVDPAFPAISATVWAPPDPCLAVGPSHVLATVNMKVAWYLKDGTPQFENFLDSSGNPGFFEEVGGGAFTFDPKCFYDERIGRFVVVALEYYSATTESWITFAVSDDSDPNGVWFKYRTPALIETTPGCRYWVDYPGFGYDGDAWYVTANLFRLSSPTSCPFFGGTLVRIFEKPGAMAGGTAVWRDVLDNGTSWQVGSSRSGADAARLVSVSSSTSLAIARVNQPLTTPSLVKATCPVPSMQNVSPATTPVGTVSIGDRRILNAAVRQGRVFASNHPAAVAGGPACAVWYEINVGSATPSLIQSGRIAAAPNEHTIFPAIAVNDVGSVALVYGRCSGTLNPTLEVAGRLPCDPPGMLGSTSVIGTSTTSPSGSNNRWGDYFAAVIDPADGCTFWVIGELQQSSGWTTEIVSLRISRTGDVTGEGEVDGRDLAAVLSGWDFPGVADLDGSGIIDGGDLSIVLSNWGPCGQ